VGVGCERERTIHGKSLDCADGDAVVAIPRLPLARNAVCEDLKPERKAGARERAARKAIFCFLGGSGEGELRLFSWRMKLRRNRELNLPSERVREPPESEKVPEG